MEKELKDISLIMGIRLRDVKIILDIITHFASETNYSGLKRHLITIFKEDIKPEHYIVLGHLIGYCLATGKEQDDKLNNYQLCLRQN